MIIISKSEFRKEGSLKLYNYVISRKDNSMFCEIQSQNFNYRFWQHLLIADTWLVWKLKVPT